MNASYKRKRVIAALLCTLVCCAMAPSGAFAAEGLEGAVVSEGDDSGVDDAVEAQVDGGNASAGPDTAAIKDEINSINDQLKDLKAQKTKVQQQIAGAKSEKEKKLVEKTSWEQKIQNSRDQIDLLQKRIELLEDQVRIKEQEIIDKQKDIDYNYDQYKKRLRASFMAGESNALSMVFKASDFTDFLMRTEVVRSTTQHDKDMLEKLRTSRAELEQAKTELNSTVEEVEGDKADVEETKKELEGELSSVKNEIEDIAMLEQAYQSNAAALAKQEKAMEAELEKFYAQLDTTTEYVGGEMGWPCPGFSTISSPYGWRFNNTNLHTGIDIASTPGRGGIYGSKVAAANGGKVVLAQSPGGSSGYGNYVIIDHGGGKSTLYAHMSSVSVSVGQTIGKGDQVGLVGQTGWATGPHLHFEVRINGKHANPIGYLK